MVHQARRQRQRLFLALLERLLVEFLALSSSAPLVYWLGCLCSLVALLVVWLDVPVRGLILAVIAAVFGCHSE